MRLFSGLLSGLFVALCCLWLLPAGAATLEVGSADRLDATGALQLCVAAPEASLAEVQQGQCQADVVAPGGILQVARGLDTRAFWLKLSLSNSAAASEERWLQVGHPRLEEVSLFLPDGRRLEAGIRTPMALREDVARHYGVLPVTLAAGTSQTVWLRVQSRTLLDIGVTVWKPNAFMESAGLMQLSLTLALGSLLAALLYSAMNFVLTREWPYVFISVAMLGEIVLESFRAGMLQRYGWPAHLPMPVEMAALASLVSIVGFIGFFFTFIPGLRRQKRAFALYAVAVGTTVLAQLWSIVVDYPSAVQLWTHGVYAILLVGLWMIWVSWRGGFAPAGTLLLGFALFMVPESLRQASVMGWLPFLRFELVSGPWALVFIVPVLFAGLAQRLRDLQSSLFQARHENQAKLDFLAHMSHELRTPLDTILGNAQLLSRPTNRKMLQEGLAHIQHSGRHLLGMIDEVLDYSRGVAGKLLIRPHVVDWADFLRTLEQNARILASKNNNAFAIQTDGVALSQVLVDEARLMQVLNNLIANAARHTQRSWIRMECTASTLPAQHADQAEEVPVRLDFLVADGGEGIAAEDQARIFLPFERAGRNAARNDKGVGMGLAIARQLVQAMGGELTVTSSPGKGSEFAFWVLAHALPHSAPPTLHEPTPAHTARYEGPQRSVLVVDDHPDSRTVLGALLRECGFVVREAASGNAALLLLQEQPQPDLVLTDQLMEDGNGWLVLQACALCNPPVPALMVSAVPPQRPTQFPQALQFAAHLLKPLDHAELVQCIGEVLQLTWSATDEAAMDEELSPAPSLVCPPAAELAVLRELIEGGQISEILSWTHTVQVAHPQYARFTQEVHVAARFLDLPALRALAGGKQGASAAAVSVPQNSVPQDL